MSLKRKTILQCLNDPFTEEVMLPSVLDEEKNKTVTLQMLILMRIQEMPSPGAL